VLDKYLEIVGRARAHTSPRLRRRPLVTHIAMAKVSRIAPALATRAPAARVSSRAVAATARYAVAPRATLANRGVAGGRVVATGVTAQARASDSLLPRATSETSETNAKAPAAPAMSDRDVTCAALFAAFAVAFFADPACAADAADTFSNLDVGSTADPSAVFDLAGGEVPFWANMVKYARFSISIMVGFVFMFGRPVVSLLKKPQTAILVLGGGFFGFKFFKFTIETMLGMNDDMTMNY